MLKPDDEILRIALVGSETERLKIIERMSELRGLIGGKISNPSAVEETAPGSETQTSPHVERSQS